MNNQCIVCCIVKNEDAYIEEWVNHHISIGFEHCVIYDHNSTAPVSELVANFKHRDKVSVIPWSKDKLAQNSAYNHCLQKYNQSKWIAVIDIDEFIYLECNNIKEFLTSYENYGGVCLNWIIYNANKHVTKPPGNVFDNFTQVATEKKEWSLIKSIVQPTKTIGFKKNPHLPEFRDDFFAVNIDFIRVTDPHSTIYTDRAYIKYFITKSFEEWLDKLDKGRPNRDKQYRQKIERFWKFNADMLDMKDYIYEKYSERIHVYNTNTSYIFI